jgi:hypothetical protein
MALKDMFKKVYSFAIVLLAVIAIFGSVFAVQRYFAKTSVVNAQVQKLNNSDHLTNSRLEIAIVDDQIFQ